ncbi:Uncharacterised protein [Citrobacter youngae]|uniref:Uncharacterized protein n=1 Tax=Citrobacter youngae TaxID=133448 RepID=A0A9Q7ZR95_9ENTR|nr:hypothetical protein SK32_00682 [Citrobacter sp. MGH100]OUE79319.1 hypothetical protein AZ013_004362 [Citrobacter freundii]CAB5588863.1 Uncharacterised protein [Citrobacter youngae]CAC9137783.1 Uncharacterised protein [Citrobacter youngae]SUX80718.1 Uncharacterised protein [Citrobacter youngae]
MFRYSGTRIHWLMLWINLLFLIFPILKIEFFYVISR